jgi:hypothetical protein
MEFLGDEPARPEPVLAAPAPSKILPADTQQDPRVQERRVLAAIQEGRQAECSADAYFSGVREALQEYTHQCIECGNMKRAAFAATELRRLDTLLQAGDRGVLAKPDSASYGADQGGAPTILDLGLINE